MMAGYQHMTLKQAVLLAAPHTWAAALCPALFGVVYCAYRGWTLSIAQSILLVAACVFLQSSVNTLNDYIDYIKGTDNKEDHVEVNDAVLVYGGFDPKSALILGIGYLLAGAICGITASIGCGIWPILIGLFGAAMVVFYSGGPIPVSYLPVGELISGFTMGGLIPLGITAVALKRPYFPVLIWALPMIVGIALIMMSNNGCDIEKDIASGRMTMPAKLGRPGTLKLYRMMVAVWIVLLIGLPVLSAGVSGMIALVLVIATSAGAYKTLFGLKLEPAERIRQMKTIVKANLLGNGSYVIAFAAVTLMGVIHG